MPFQYSCFISYRHSQDDITRKLVLSLETELVRWLDMSIFVDKERLTGGDFFNNKLAKALCESVCLIVIYTPTYFSKKNSYCAREYKAMELLEEQRLHMLGLPKNKKQGLIIPIIYRGEKILPDEIKNKRQFHVFEDFQISGRDNLENPEYAEKIKKIAEYVQERCSELLLIEETACKTCDVFDFPSEKDISDWLEIMLPPKPKLPSREEIK